MLPVPSSIRLMSISAEPRRAHLMHLLVLSAFRPSRCRPRRRIPSGLNAPSGAQCFPTRRRRHRPTDRPRLNAPSGAQCFPTLKESRVTSGVTCLNAPSGAQRFPTPNGAVRESSIVPSLNALLVLSAFRRDGTNLRTSCRSRVSMHLLVLSAFRPIGTVESNNRWDGLNAPSGAQCFPTREEHVGTMPPDGVSMHLLVLSAFRRGFCGQ